MKIALGTLKDKREELAAFLEPRVGTAPSVSGDAIEIDDGGVREGVKPRDVKTYIKRFMYMNGVRKKYRVFVAGKELTVQEIELAEKEEKEEAKPEAPAPEETKGEAPATEEKEEKPKAEKPKKSAAKKPRAKKKKEESEA